MAKQKRQSKARKADTMTSKHDGTLADEAEIKKKPAEVEILDPDEAETTEECESSEKPEKCEETLPAPAAAADALQRYLWEIRRYPLLTREEEKEVAQHFKNTGDPEAAAKLVTSNLRLVVKIAMDHQRYWMRNLLDLIQEGNMGLLQAVQKYDPFRGIKFSYYASFWIKAYILKFIMDNWRLVRLGTTQAQRKLFYNLRREKEKLKAQGITPQPKLLSDRLGVTEQDVVDMNQRLDSWELSLDAPVRADSDDDHQGFLPDDKPSVEESLASGQVRELFHEKLMEFRETLDEKERDILDKRLLSESPLTLSQLGDLHGISRERIRQLQVRMLEKLREYIEDNVPDFEAEFGQILELD
jgi:RNA polymerase sigma-32 factor